MKRRVPKRMLARSGIERTAQVTVENGSFMLRRPTTTVRAGWADDARRIAALGNDGLVTGEFANDTDSTPAW
jgi:antitoxin MazE